MGPHTTTDTTEPAMTQHTITTSRTTDALEATDTDENPLAFVRYTGPVPQVGDGIILESANGDTFLGKVVDAEETGHYYVTLI